MTASLTTSATLGTRFVASAVAGWYAGQIFVEPGRPHDAWHPPNHNAAEIILFSAAFAGGAIYVGGRKAFKFIRKVL